MTQIDKTKPVLVTGATGYVAGHLVKKLLEEGITVHAAVRDPENLGKIAHLNQLAEQLGGSIYYFRSDLLKMGSYAAGMKGCELVFHTASPFISEVDNPQKDLVDPALEGTRNVLETANNISTVKRVVLTSSCAAIYTDAIDCQQGPNGILTEEIWNTTASLTYQPYFYSKYLAEKEAWKMEKEQTQWDLVTINPALVMGPTLNPGGTTSESFSILKQIGDGSLKVGAPKLGIGLIDVRDVAVAHFKAGFFPKAKGRYITFAHQTDFLEMSKTLLPKYGATYPIPKNKIPKWILMLVGPLANKAFSRKFIKNNVNIEWRADNSKIKRDFGMTFRSMKETMEDSFQVLIDEKII